MIQRKYILDIEKNLYVKCEDIKNRKIATEFIKEFADANREFNETNGILPHPTGNQLRKISHVENIFKVKFNGKTLKEAYDFIANYWGDMTLKQKREGMNYGK